MAITTCIFDAYGTLFDVQAAAREAAKEAAFAPIADTWPELADTWRRKQLEYTWLRAITGPHTDFWQVTGDALDWTLESMNLAAHQALRERLMRLYWDLAAFPEVPGVLRTLKSKGLATGILSNGAPDMLAGAVRSAGIGRHLDHILSVETVGVFKPDTRVYDLVGQTFGTAKEEVFFVSSNGWDAAAATGYGFVTAWVNRTGLPVEKLPNTPTHIFESLEQIPALITNV